jgi:hypothetical protein
MLSTKSGLGQPKFVELSGFNTLVKNGNPSSFRVSFANSPVSDHSDSRRETKLLNLKIKDFTKGKDKDILNRLILKKANTSTQSPVVKSKKIIGLHDFSLN